MSTDGFRFRWERALRASELGKAARAVGFVMGTYANMDGTKVHPGIDLLAGGSGYGDRQTRAAVKALEAAGFVAVVRPGNGLQAKAAEYRLTIPQPPRTGKARHADRQSTTPIPANHDTGTCRVLPTTRSGPDQNKIRTNSTVEAEAEIDEIPEVIRALIAMAPAFDDGDATPQDTAAVEAALAASRPQATPFVDPFRSSPPRTPGPKEQIYSHNALVREAREQGFDPTTGEYADRTSGRPIPRSRRRH